LNIYGSNLIIRTRFSKNKSMKDMKWCVKEDSMWWRRVSGCSIQGIKLTMKNHISLSVNLYWIKKWSDMNIKSEYWSYDVEYSKSQPLKSHAKARSNVATLIKSKRNEVTRFIIVQAQVEEIIFIFNLEYTLPLYQEGYHMDC
jgi:hypothetical protein